MTDKNLWVVMGDCGRPERIFKSEKSAMKFAELNGLLEFHMRETDNIHNGVYEVEYFNI